MNLFSKSKIFLAMALSMAMMPTLSMASPMVGDIAVVADGDVLITFQGKDASYPSRLFMVGGLYPIWGDMLGDPGYPTPGSTTINLGYFSAGTILVFGLEVLDPLPATYTYLTGLDGSVNPDGDIHALLDDMPYPGGLLVGFEDIFDGGSDMDFNDLEFSLTNVRAVPEPGTIILLGTGLVGMAAWRSRKVRKS